MPDRRVVTAPARVHGGVDPAELRSVGVSPEEAVDFSHNVNPYGPSPKVAEAARSADLGHYPDPRASAVRAALAARWRTDPEGVLFAHGAAEILWDLARQFARYDGPTLILEPAFSELGSALAASGARVTSYRREGPLELEVDLEDVSEQLSRSGARAAYLAAPTSPAGLPVPVLEVARLARAHPRVTFVLDESFLALSERHADADVPVPSNVARVRSLTKEHAIPGIRAGYLLAEPALAAALEASRPAWSTSAPAQAAALAAVAEEAFVAESRARLAMDRDALRRGLARLGIDSSPSIAPYVLFHAGDAAAVRRRLLERGIVVRDCTSFGLPAHIRVAARPERERERLLAALEEELS